MPEGIVQRQDKLKAALREIAAYEPQGMTTDANWVAVETMATIAADALGAETPCPICGGTERVPRNRSRLTPTDPCPRCVGPYCRVHPIALKGQHHE